MNERLANISGTNLDPSPSIRLGVIPASHPPGEIDESIVRLNLAKQLGLPFVQLDKVKIQEAAVDAIPLEIAKRYCLIPLAFHQNNLVVAMGDPLDSEACGLLNFLTKHPVEIAVASRADIERAIIRIYVHPQCTKYIQEDLRKLEAENIEIAPIEDKATEKTEPETISPIIRLTENLLADAIHRHASDIHLRPEQNRIELIYRIDGSLIPIHTMAKSILRAMVGRIKVMGHMDVTETRMPQDGNIKVTIDRRSVDLRVSIIPTVYGESVVMRILDALNRPSKLDHSGLPEKLVTELKCQLRRGYGMILVTGPTGSGKSSTLQMALKEVAAQNRNIISVEDPVEYSTPGIQQIQVNNKIGLTFARVLRNILRHDPDVIMIGEIRDHETALIAAESALTGHLVLSSLHTNTAAGAIARLLEMGIASYVINAALLAVLSQRLVRINCPHCLQPELIADPILSALGLDATESFMTGAGCDKCNKTGFKGRQVVAEILIINDVIRAVIKQGGDENEIQALAVQAGMVTLSENALALARSHKTSFAEIFGICFRGERKNTDA